MQLKGQAASDFAAKPAPGIWCVLAFGEDAGVAQDASRQILSYWQKQEPALEVSTLDEEAVRKDPALLFESLEAVSLLGGARVLRLRLSGEKIAALLIEAIQAGEHTPERISARLLIEAGALPAKSKLRAAAEGAKRVAVLNLSADSAATLAERAREALEAEGARIEPEALALFVTELPGHRSLANLEIEKLCLYAIGLGRALNLDDVRSLSASGVDHEVSQALRRVLEGRPLAAAELLDRLEAAGTGGISLLRALQFETLRMIEAGQRMQSGESNPGMKLRPPVWGSDWDAMRARIDRWPPRRLMRILERLYEAEAQAKLAGATAPSTVRVLLNDLARAASR
jgi:DNA polymerase-3 subunit delta